MVESSDVVDSARSSIFANSMVRASIALTCGEVLLDIISTKRSLSQVETHVASRVSMFAVGE